MVPHIRVEEAIAAALRLDEDDLKVAVTAVPDPKKGERLVVLYTDLLRSPEEICRVFRPAGCRRLDPLGGQLPSDRHPAPVGHRQARSQAGQEVAVGKSPGSNFKGILRLPAGIQ